MKEVNNWVNVRRPIVYPVDADGRRVRLNLKMCEEQALNLYQLKIDKNVIIILHFRPRHHADLHDSDHTVD